MTINLKNFYYNKPIEEIEYVQLSLTIIPQEIIDKYRLDTLARNGVLFMEIQKKMPGLKQAGRLAHDRLKTHLSKDEYFPVLCTASIWKHKKNIMSTLVIDDLLLSLQKRRLQHLVSSLKAL